MSREDKILLAAAVVVILVGITIMFFLGKAGSNIQIVGTDGAMASG